MPPCRTCLNCRNGYPQLCLHARKWDALSAEPPANENVCTDCDTPVPPRARYCPTCRARRRKATHRAYNRTRQNRQVQTTTVNDF